MPTVTKSRIRLYAALLVSNLIIFALSASVNTFTKFYYFADVFPFVLSIITFVVVGATLFLDRLKGSNPFLSRPIVELSWLVLLFIFWLCTNAFSSSRWKYVQAGDCASINTSESDLSAIAVWCKEIQALRAFVWVEWVTIGFTLIWLWTFTVREKKHGNRHIWSTSFARPQKTSQAHLSWDAGNPRRSMGAQSRASSFHTGEDQSRYSSQSQTFQNDFEKASQEHWQNTRGHAQNASGSSNYYGQQGGTQQYQQQGYEGYGQHQQWVEQQWNEQQGYYQSQQPYYQAGPQQQDYTYHQSQPSQQSHEGYIFGGFGQAR